VPEEVEEDAEEDEEMVRVLPMRLARLVLFRVVEEVVLECSRSAMLAATNGGKEGERKVRRKRDGKRETLLTHLPLHTAGRPSSSEEGGGKEEEGAGQLEGDPWTCRRREKTRGRRRGRRLKGRCCL
jgi:hypothetical protein